MGEHLNYGKNKGPVNKVKTSFNNSYNIYNFYNTFNCVIDVEFYGDKEKNPPTRSQVEQELQTMVKMLEEHYGKRVILYTTNKAYDLYIKNSFEQCDIWIRDVFAKPSLPDKRTWTFWQYTDREQLIGYSGEEKFIDVNVFKGSEKKFKEYGN